MGDDRDALHMSTSAAKASNDRTKNRSIRLSIHVDDKHSLPKFTRRATGKRAPEPIENPGTASGASRIEEREQDRESVFQGFGGCGCLLRHAGRGGGGSFIALAKGIAQEVAQEVKQTSETKKGSKRLCCGPIIAHKKLKLDIKMREKATGSLSSNKQSGFMACTPWYFSTLAIVVIIFLLPSFGYSLSLRSNPDVPPDPCLDFAKRCDKAVNTNVTTPTSEAGCPRYHPNILDGRVCIGCFRDDYEIEHWGRLSFAKRAYALEDASDRAQAMEAVEDNEEKDKLLEASIPVEGLRRQALLWRALAEKESALEASDSDIDGLSRKLNHSTNGDSFDAKGINSDSTVRIPSVVAISTNTPTNSKSTNVPKAEIVEELKTNSGRSTKQTQTNGLPTHQKEVEQTHLKGQQQSPPPPTPCTRICRYNADCYDGKVCIGCFRDTHDIAQWSSMSPVEKMFSLEDAADRCKDLSDRGKDTDSCCFEGGITEEALRDQATLWGAWKG